MKGFFKNQHVVGQSQNKMIQAYGLKRMSTTVGVVCFYFLVLIFSSYSWAFEPALHIGNDPRYFNCVGCEQDSPLKKKKILFLGSSVTRGACSLGVSFADMLRRKYDFLMIKDVVDGTLLVEKGESSYISRLKKYTRSSNIDLLVVQLSTNDSHTKDLIEGKQTNTIGGGILFIVEYAHNILRCPVLFYTCPYFGNEKFRKMCDFLYKFKEDSTSRTFYIADIFRNGGFQQLSSFEFQLCMFDPIHPTQAGYFRWLPLFEEQLSRIFPQEEHKR